MIRKRAVFSALAVALAGVSLIVGSATASAAEILNEVDQPVPTGTEVWFESENLTKKYGNSYPWTCDRVVVPGEVTANSEGTVTVVPTYAGEAEGCEYHNPLWTHPINLEATLQGMTMSSTESTMSLKFSETSKSFESCVSAGALPASITENGGVSVYGQVKTISGCYGSGTAVVSGSFAIGSAEGTLKLVE